MHVQALGAPDFEPVTLDEIKEHLHYSADDQDDRITALISVARAACEQETDRVICSQSMRLTLDSFPAGVILLPRPPVLSVTSVSYTDANDTVVVMPKADYMVDLYSEPGRIAPAKNLNWPSTSTDVFNPVQILYTAGWDSAESIPVEIKHAVKLLCGNWFDNLSAMTMEGTPKELPLSVSMLLTHWKFPG
ncbi:phage head-tail connector protein [Candidatus Pacearchaeota archaeon]|jgi:uncharacterized phiE125 gp8 family phage protein|nr:phage head-tail connector protein [Candidatus Pacearchaeota archaeon]